MPASTTPAPSEKAFANAGTEALARERDHGYAPARQTEPRAHAGALDFGFYRVHRGGLLQRVARRETIRRHQRSEEHTSELQSPCNLVCRLLLEKKTK